MQKEFDKDITEMGGKNFMVDNNGTVMYVSYASDTNERNLIIINATDKQLNKIPLILNSSQQMEGVNIISANNVAVVGGFFKENSGQTKKAGIFCQTFDITTKKNIKSSQQYLSDELITTLFASKDDYEDKYIDIDNARLIGNNFYFIGKDVEKDVVNKERTTYSTNTSFNHTYTSSGLVSSHTTTTTSHTSTTHSASYKSDKVIVFKVTEDGQTDWIKDISASSNTIVAAVNFLVSPNTILRPEVISFDMDEKLLVIHGDVKIAGMSRTATNISYTLFDQKGVYASDKLCLDEKKCFLYNALGIYGYFNIYYQHGKNLIVYYNQKDNQHFGRIAFK